MSEKTTQASIMAGYGVIGLFVVGIAALVVALLAVVNEADFIGAGLCLLAAATAFGHLVNAVFRA